MVTPLMIFSGQKGKQNFPIIKKATSYSIHKISQVKLLLYLSMIMYDTDL